MPLETELKPMRRSGKKDSPWPASKPTTSQGLGDAGSKEIENRKKPCIEYFYDSKTGELCGRTFKSWIAIIAYTIIYLLFLSAFFLVFLYVSLHLVKQLVDFKSVEKIDLLTYPEHGIGLTAAPTSENNYPLIWYKSGEKEDYSKYVQALDKLLSSNRRKREVSNLGPCGQSPYGYGTQPCVIVRVNKQLNWAGQPLKLNSTIAKSAPAEVQKWMRADNTKLWLQCSGYHSYDKEHIGKIKYYPDPPGFDPDVFPLDKDKKSPLVAVQISDFTLGISLAIQCKLWYDAGPSTINFVLYVAPEDRIAYSTPASISV